METGKYISNYTYEETALIFIFWCYIFQYSQYIFYPFKGLTYDITYFV